MGHSAFIIEHKNRLIIDPYIETIPEVDYVLVTHAHNDHFGNTIEIAKKNNAKVISIYEIAEFVKQFNIESIGMNFGGTIDIGEKVSLVPAVHSSTLYYNGKAYPLGNPGGFVIKGNKTIYHAGDTMVFKDMELIGELFKIDVALLPIGGVFTMDIDQALKAIDLLKPKIVIPMHYNTWPIIKADPYEFKRKAEEKGVEAIVLNKDEEIDL